MHCQLKTMEAAKESGGEALLQVKGNQPSLGVAFEALPAKQEPVDCNVETGSIARNRQETRKIKVFKASNLFSLPDDRDSPSPGSSPSSRKKGNRLATRASAPR